MANYDVIISGAGIPGMALASILAHSGLKTCLLDAAPPPKKHDPTTPNGRTIALMNPSIDILKLAHMWDGAQQFATPLANMCVIDDSQYPKGELLEQTFKSAEIGEQCFGYNTPLTALRAALPTHKNLTFLPNTRLIAINTPTTGATSGKSAGKNITITLSDGQTLTAQLLIGADGKNSAVRTLSNIQTTTRPYGQTAIVCVINHTLPHHNTSTEFHRPGGPFTLVPMPGLQSAIVWVEKTPNAAQLLSLPRPGFEQALSDRTRARLGQITLLTNPASFPLEYMLANKLTAPRTALMAEAAHAMSPIGAQGMNLSLRDVEALSSLIITHHQNGLDIGSKTLLNAYEKSRKSDLLTRTTAIDFANRTVASDSKLLRLLRRTTLHALSLPTPLRKLAMKSGLSA